MLLFKAEGSAPFLHQIMDVLSRQFPVVQVQVLNGDHAPHTAEMARFLEIVERFWAAS